jgi:hypothetical protein
MAQDLEKFTSDLEEAIDSGTGIQSPIYTPPMLRGKRTKVLYALKQKSPTIRENVVRIETEADPIGLLIAIANGIPVASFHIDEDGNITTKYETAPLKLRLQASRSLLDKVMPKVSVQASLTSKHKGDDSRIAALVGRAEADHDESGNNPVSAAGTTIESNADPDLPGDNPDSGDLSL